MTDDRVFWLPTTNSEGTTVPLPLTPQQERHLRRLTANVPFCASTYIEGILEDEQVLLPELRPVRLVAPSPVCTAAHFEARLHDYCQKHDLTIRITGLIRDFRGFLLSVHNCAALKTLWNHKEAIQLATGWKLRPRRPARPLLKLDNLPVDITTADIAAELFQPTRPELYALREFRKEVSFRLHKGRMALIRSPPELREALLTLHETQGLIIRVCHVQVQDCYPLRLCSNCSSPTHGQYDCQAAGPTCAYCNQQHYTDECKHKTKEARHDCVHCARAGILMVDREHSGMDGDKCPQLDHAVKAQIRAREYRPEVYRLLERLWRQHCRRFEEAPPTEEDEDESFY